MTLLRKQKTKCLSTLCNEIPFGAVLRYHVESRVITLSNCFSPSKCILTAPVRTNRKSIPRAARQLLATKCPIFFIKLSVRAFAVGRRRLWSFALRARERRIALNCWLPQRCSSTKLANYILDFVFANLVKLNIHTHTQTLYREDI